MEIDVSDDDRYQKKLSTQHVRLIIRKKEYIVEFQKAKEKGVILQFSKEMKKKYGE